MDEESESYGSMDGETERSSAYNEDQWWSQELFVGAKLNVTKFLKLFFI